MKEHFHELTKVTLTPPYTASCSCGFTATSADGITWPAGCGVLKTDVGTVGMSHGYYKCRSCGARVHTDVFEEFTSSLCSACRKTDAEEAEMLRDLESAANAKIGHLERELASLRPSWTKTPPTMPGWYWGLLEDGGVKLIEVCIVFGSLHACQPEGPTLDVVPLQDYRLWAGPIEPPEVPK